MDTTAPVRGRDDDAAGEIGYWIVILSISYKISYNMFGLCDLSRYWLWFVSGDLDNTAGWNVYFLVRFLAKGWCCYTPLRVRVVATTRLISISRSSVARDSNSSAGEVTEEDGLLSRER